MVILAVKLNQFKVNWEFQIVHTVIVASKFLTLMPRYLEASSQASSELMKSALNRIMLGQ